MPNEPTLAYVRLRVPKHRVRFAWVISLWPLLDLAAGTSDLLPVLPVKPDAVQAIWAALPVLANLRGASGVFDVTEKGEDVHVEFRIV